MGQPPHHCAWPKAWAAETSGCSPPPPISPQHGVFLPFISESSHQYSNKAGAAPRLCAPLTAQHGQGCATPLCSPCQAPRRHREHSSPPPPHRTRHHVTSPLPAAPSEDFRGESRGEGEQANRVQDGQQRLAGQHPEHRAGVPVTPLLLCPGCQGVQSPPTPQFPHSPFRLLCFLPAWAHQASSRSALS